MWHRTCFHGQFRGTVFVRIAKTTEEVVLSEFSALQKYSSWVLSFKGQLLINLLLVLPLLLHPTESPWEQPAQ